MYLGFNLAAAILAGAFLSIRDIRYGKISNRDLFVVALSGLALSLLEYEPALAGGLASNFVLSLAAGFLLWKAGVWSAGDGKLFAAYSLFLPWQAYLAFFPSQFLFYNVFLISFFVWMPAVLLKTSWEDKKRVLSIAFGKKMLFSMAVTLFGFFWVIGRLFKSFGVDALLFYLIAGIVLLYIAKAAFPKRLMFLLYLLAVLRFFADSSIYTIPFVVSFLVFVFGIQLAYAVGLLSHHVAFDVKKLRDIRVGDEPLGLVQGRTSAKIDFNSFMRRYFGVHSQRILERGFEQKDVVRARKLQVAGFAVKKRIAFVPLLSAALVMTILLGQDIFLYLVSMFYHVLLE